MKLRSRGNSLRLRLQKREVQTLSEQGLLEEKTSFGKQFLTYAIESDSGNEITSSFLDNRITVKIPHHIIQHWAQSELITLHAEQKLNENEKLNILVEKDFFCLKPRAPGMEEDESDAFPNPNESCGHAAH